jgi:uncharacterized protein YjbJ (UPF0337 family)
VTRAGCRRHIGYAVNEVLDEEGVAMSVMDKAKNSLRRMVGRGERDAGRVSGDRTMETRGATRKIKGDVRQAGENLKDTMR